ncbi:hypothetical protein FJZ33_03155 [Candidatus Poribacteria bacterium]|nr:hypothetical protein [Candidatus Poribacteria bacterium]
MVAEPKKEDLGSLVIKVEKPKLVSIPVKIVGDTSLIQQVWTEKAKNEMREKHLGVRKIKRPVRNTKQEFEDSYYRNSENKPAFPAGCIKHAIVDTAYRKKFIGQYDKPLLRGAFRIIADGKNLVEVKYKKLVMREDNVNVGGKSRSADLRYRAEFQDWSMEFKVVLETDIIDPQTFMNILSHAGFSNGLGEWRIEKGGTFGQFHVEGLEI